MLDLIGQAKTLNLISREQWKAMADAIDREGWRDIVEFALLELGKHVESKQIHALQGKDWKAPGRVMQLVSQDGHVGVARCRVCGATRDVHQTVLGDWKRGTWQCKDKCKLTPSTTPTETGTGPTIS
jgi:hypothetical protein